MSLGDAVYDRHQPLSHGDWKNVEAAVHIAAPTSVACDNVYRQQADATLQFEPAARVKIGSISWPLRPTFIVDEDDRKELASWGPVTVSPPLKREKPEDFHDAPEEGSKRHSRPRLGSVWPVPTPSSSGAVVPVTPIHPRPQILVPRTELRTPDRSSGILSAEKQHGSEILMPETDRRELSPQPLRSCLPQTQAEFDEYKHLSQAFGSFLSVSSIPDSQPSQIPASRVPPAAVFVTDTPTASFVPETPIPQARNPQSATGRLPPLLASASQPQSQLLIECQSTPTPLPSTAHGYALPTPAPPRFSSGPVLVYSTPAPTTSSLELLPGFTPTAASQASDDSQYPPPPPFNVASPIPMLVGPPYMIAAPPPATSSKPAQIPALLVEVVQKNVPGKFMAHLESMTRPLRRWERGYWRVDMSSWMDPQHKVMFWNITKDNILTGRFGMSAMVLETEEYQDTEGMWTDLQDLGKGERRREMERRGNLVRVYCWGGTAEMVWCVLYITGWRGLDGTVWIDAGGEEVVRMISRG
ncbi:hypothetical protein FN846DRAFT_891515 [Sphaerosporella brunnea]|uniref:Uncharacterized protein n=1 Tax=Sphaerosporella brunnea TaxID=1250544 RepID=A0A5J5ETA4_9PEZI|nr:hypothetical protein FN846DRAFT_891515 [Sphaerosporella brunnea]